MKPYFDTNHLAGLLLLVVALGWGMMEIAHAGNSRPGAIKVRGGGRWLVLLPALTAATVLLHLAPHIVPAAAIRPGAAAFAIGMVILVAGLVLRGWSIMTLGEYFTGTVLVSADQPVVTAGPYRVLRHPSYMGAMLAFIGVGLTAANWVSLAAMALLPLAAILWRIRAEERALLATLGDRYRAYAARHKRLIPLVW
jgi:protein-S-isoprenylcysteine O-methyltransferase Ste14